MYRLMMDVGGLFWAVTYLLIIRQGFRDKSFGVPLFALGANLAWEATFSLIYPAEPVQQTMNLLWLALDLVILWQVIKFGSKEFPFLSKTQFPGALVLALLTGFGFVLGVTHEFSDYSGAYAAFGQNLAMSILFIAMLLNRNSLRGQSLYIGITKLLGTGISSLAFLLYQPIAQSSPLFYFLFASILFYDVLYVALVWQMKRKKA